jgi:hypothetical protein
MLKDIFTVKEISDRACNIYGQLFSEKLFRAQLAFHKDIDYTEPVEFLVEPVPDKVIRAFLIDVAIDI